MALSTSYGIHSEYYQLDKLRFLVKHCAHGKSQASTLFSLL